MPKGLTILVMMLLMAFSIIAVRNAWTFSSLIILSNFVNNKDVERINTGNRSYG
jgi:hypothetical protein